MQSLKTRFLHTSAKCFADAVKEAVQTINESADVLCRLACEPASDFTSK